MGRFKFNVFDKLNNKNILENADCEEVHKKIGLKAYSVTTYANEGRVYHGKYLITYGEDVPLNDEKELGGEDLKCINEFIKAMEALKHNYTPEYLSKIMIVRKANK